MVEATSAVSSARGTGLENVPVGFSSALALLCRAGDNVMFEDHWVTIVAVERGGLSPPFWRTGDVWVSAKNYVHDFGWIGEGATPGGDARKVPAAALRLGEKWRPVFLPDKEWFTSPATRFSHAKALIILRALLVRCTEDAAATIQHVQASNLGRRTESLFSKPPFPLGSATLASIRALTERFGKSFCDPFCRQHSGPLCISCSDGSMVTTTVGQFHCISGLIDIDPDVMELLTQKGRGVKRSADESGGISLLYASDKVRVSILDAESY